MSDLTAGPTTFESPDSRRLSATHATALLATIAFAATVAFRLTLILRYRIDSDETQHLHVAWGWSRGLLQYRDLFDNHMPLFHILASPLLLFGESSQTLLAARVTMLPLFAITAWLTWRIGISCYPRRRVIVATVIGCLAPDFFLCSIEFRPDLLWAIFWLATLLILVEAPLTVPRAAAAGCTLGLAASISAKTSLLAATLAVSALVAIAVTRDARTNLRHLARCAASFAGAAAIPPLLIAAYFAARGAWRPFLYGTIQHNLVTSEHPNRLLLAPFFLVILAVLTRRVARDEDVPIAIRRRRIFLLLCAYGYAAALISLWPIIETEHWLPFYPLAAVATIALIPRGRVAARASLAVVVFELVWILVASTPWRNEVTPTLALIDDTLKLTRADETVVDLKGDMVFRRRAFYYVLEKITKRAISEGRLPDTIAADVIRSRTMVVVRDNVGLPPAGRDFLQENFVNAGCVRIAGMMVPESQKVSISIPAEYSLVSAHSTFSGLLDGVPYAGPRYLGAGLHSIEPAHRGDPSALLWARAAASGFSPFVSDTRCPPQSGSPLAHP